MAFVAWLLVASPARAQDNYEIQVYDSETVEKGHTMVELHSNFTFQAPRRAKMVCTRQITNGTKP